MKTHKNISSIILLSSFTIFQGCDIQSSEPENESYFANQKPEKSLEERLKDYQDHEQEYIKYWKDWW